MIERVISGGQTGADQAGWRAARRFGISCGGWMPRCFITEAGNFPEFAEMYGAREHESANYSPRTRANVAWADMTLVFDVSIGANLTDLSRGTQLAINTAISLGKPSVKVTVFVGEPLSKHRPAAMADRIRDLGVKVLNVAGNRESTAPGVGAWTEDYLAELFRQLGFTEAP